MPVASGLQTATIVGLEGEALSTERNHRVKVQFAWQRNTTPTGVEVHNAPGNETSATWVRVSEALAGPNWGTQFTPRIKVEVLGGRPLLRENSRVMVEAVHLNLRAIALKFRLCSSQTCIKARPSRLRCM